MCAGFWWLLFHFRQLQEGFEAPVFLHVATATEERNVRFSVISGVTVLVVPIERWSCLALVALVR